MSTTVVVNGLNYFIPAVGDNNWGQNVTDALVALATAASSNASVYNRVTVTSSPITVVSGRTYLVDTSSARTLNLPSPANNAYLFIKDTTGGAASNNITVHRFASESIDGVASDKTLNLNRGFWGYVSDGTNWFSVTPPYPLPYSFLTLTGSILNADLAGSIAVNKLVALGTSKAVATDGSGFLVAATTTATELGYLSGVTSAIQTQIDAKLALAGGTLTGAITSNPSATLAVDQTFTNSTNSQTGFIGHNAGTSTLDFSVAGNRHPTTGTYTKTGQGSSQVTLTSGNGVGQVDVYSSTTNNAGPSVVASFRDTGCSMKGTTTNDSATAGNVGEIVSSVVSANTNVPTSGQYGDLTSISLTAGDWDVSVIAVVNLNGGTASGFSAVGVSTTTGNSSTGLVFGDSEAVIFLSSSITQATGTIPPKRFSLSATTTVYLKYTSTYSAGTPVSVGRVSARRVR